MRVPQVSNMKRVLVGICRKSLAKDTFIGPHVTVSHELKSLQGPNRDTTEPEFVRWEYFLLGAVLKEGKTTNCKLLNQVRGESQ